MTAPELERAFIVDHPDLFRLGLEIMGVYGGYSEEGSDEFSIGIAVGAKNEDQIFPSTHYLSVQHPFLFDHRRIPEFYKDFTVRRSIARISYWPKEFPEVEDEPVPLDEYYDPQKFIDFVEREEDHIRQALENPDLTKQEMLDIFSFGDFEEHKRRMHQKKLIRLGIDDNS